MRVFDKKATRDMRLPEIPVHWDSGSVRSIVDNCVTKNSGAKNQNYLSLVAGRGVIPYAEKGDIGNKKPDDLEKCKIVNKGNLVINSMNYAIGSYGMARHDGICSPVYVVLNPKKETVHPQFALRVFEEKSFQKHAASFGNGILEHRAAINWDTLKGIKLGIPPILEQRQIAAYLNREIAKIDKLITKQHKLITLLQEKSQAVISLAVTKGLDPNVKKEDSGVEWVGDIPAHWKVLKLGMRYEVLLGKMLDEKKITGEYSVPYLRNRDVQWGVINSENLPEMDIRPSELLRFTVKAGDLLVCEGGDVGRAAIWKGPDNCVGYQKALHRLRPKNFKADISNYLFYLLIVAKKRGAFEINDTKATISHLPAEDFRQHKFVFPPIDEQILIVDYLAKRLAKFEELELKSNTAIRILGEHRQALITAAVTGKIDVRGLVTDEEVAALDADPVLETTEEDFESDVAEADYITEEE